MKYVRVKATTVINNVTHAAGAIAPWPVGVEKLGPNLEEYILPLMVDPGPQLDLDLEPKSDPKSE